MARIIEAKAVISAEDKTGAVFDKIAQKIDGLAKSAKSSKAIDNMAKALERAKSQMEAIDKYASSRSSFEFAQKKLKATQAAVEAHQAAMSSMAAPNRGAAEAEQRRLARAVDQASRAYDAQKAAVFANRAALERTGSPIKDAITHQTRLRAAVAATTAAIEKQAQKQERREVVGQRLQRGTAIAAGVIGAGSKVGRMSKSVIEAAAEFDTATLKQQAFQDIPKAVQDALLIPQAKKIGQETKFSNTDVLKAQIKSMQGLPAGFGPQQKAETAVGITGAARNYAIAMEADLETSAEGIRSFLQTTNKDISTKEKAIAASTRATNIMVKTAKLGGLDDNDVQQFFKFGAGTGTAAGLSDTTLGALAATGRQGGLRGDELGVFTRAIASKLVAPTGKGLDALTAAGIDYNQFTKMPGGLSVANLEGLSKRRFGKGFNGSQVDRLDEILDNPEVVSNKEEFTKQVSEILAESYTKKKNGETKAQDSQKIAKMVGDFHKLSTESVDSEGLLNAIMTNPKMSIALLNAMFTDKHGGKGSILASKWGEFQTNKGALDKVGETPTFAKDIADKIMGGFGGAVENFKGSVENLKLAIGQAIAPGVKPAMNVAGSAMDYMSNLPGPVLGIGAGAAAVGSVGAAGFFMSKLMGGFGLSASAVALDGAATALTTAATVMKGGPIKDILKDAAPIAGGAASGGLWAAGAAALPWLGGAAAVGGSMLALRAAVDSEGYAGMTSGDRMRKQRGGSMRDMYAREWGYSSGGPELSDTMKYGTGVGGDKSISVSGRVEGEATVQVTASSDLISIVDQAKQAIKLAGSLQSNGPGSTGKSSPDAAAPSVGASGAW